MISRSYAKLKKNVVTIKILDINQLSKYFKVKRKFFKFKNNTLEYSFKQTYLEFNLLYYII